MFDTGAIRRCPLVLAILVILAPGCADEPLQERPFALRGGVAGGPRRDAGDANADAGPTAPDAGLDASSAIDAGRDAAIAIDAASAIDAGAIDAGAIDAGTDSGMPTGSGAHVYVAAHPDDDLLFMNPDVEDSFRGGAAIRVIYITSGDAGQPASYWLSREDGIRSAYAAMARVSGSWTCGARTYAGARAQVCTLATTPAIGVVFLRLPDGRLGSLWATDGGPPFWVAPAGALTTVDGASAYTRDDLVAVLAAILAELVPARVGTLDGTLAYGDDHGDHVASAMFALEAIHAGAGVADVRAYRGYTMYQDWSAIPEPLPRDLTTAQHDEKVRLMNAYGASASPGNIYDEWCWRQYRDRSVIGGPGPLSQGSRCIDVDGGAPIGGAAVIASACSGSASQRWTVRADGSIVGAGGLCLTLGAGGSTMLASCTGAPQQRWTLFDSGQLRGVDASCLTLGGDLVTLTRQLCASEPAGTRLTVAAAQRWAR